MEVKSQNRSQSPLAMPRFTVIHEPDYAWVRDNESESYRMPERAVAINMTTESAEEVARILNMEWRKFQARPY